MKTEKKHCQIVKKGSKLFQSENTMGGGGLIKILHTNLKNVNC